MFPPEVNLRRSNYSWVTHGITIGNGGHRFPNLRSAQEQAKNTAAVPKTIPRDGNSLGGPLVTNYSSRKNHLLPLTLCQMQNKTTGFDDRGENNEQETA